MKCTHLVVFLLGLFLPSISSRHVEFYRRDYSYNEDFDVFYKVHLNLNGASWNTAFTNCQDEGATLFYPTVKEDYGFLKNLTYRRAEVPNATKIYVGLHDKFKLGAFISIDGHLIPYPRVLEKQFDGPDVKDCVLLDLEKESLVVDSCDRFHESPIPFVCKKREEKLCPTVDRGYKYDKELKKCYKMNKTQKTWQEAMQTCFNEGGLLAVIENHAQANAIKDIIESETNYHVGVRKMTPFGFRYSVKGDKYIDMYQNDISEERDGEDCGCVTSNNGEYLKTCFEDCKRRLPFICQLEVTL